MAEIISSLQFNFPTIINSLKDFPNDTVKDFVVLSTQHFDSSHNWEHALAVTLNAIEILKNDKNISIDDKSSNDQIELIMNVVFIAMLHDVCDHKYPDSIPIEALANFYKTIHSEHNMHLKIINNISWSKERKGFREIFNPYWTQILNVVSDADRIEAIGCIGVERCIAFTNATNGIVPDDVIRHYHEKLKLLYIDKYIRTQYGRIIAKPRHDEMTELIEDMALSVV